jgi:hypothetical protein
MNAAQMLILRFTEIAWWAIVHSVWQRVVTAAVLWLALACIGDSRIRYRLACVAMAALVIWPVVTVAAGDRAVTGVRFEFSPSRDPHTGFPIAVRPESAETLARIVQLRFDWIVGVAPGTRRSSDGWSAMRTHQAWPDFRNETR